MAQDIHWEKLDKQKFLVWGAGLFSGLTTVLFPLTVVKTRQQAIEGTPGGISGAVQIAKDVVRRDGVRGLYRGFGTVIIGIIPARGVYLTTLEMTKAKVADQAELYSPSAPVASAITNFAGGAIASLVTQSVVVPIDVVSQRLMVAGDSGAYTLRTSKGAASAEHVPRPKSNGLQVALQIFQREGIRGLYRGFGASVFTFVPSSALWWSAYGGYQRALWRQIDRRRGFDPDNPPSHTEEEMVLVQAASALLGGCTSALLTTPLDTVKTRLQVAERQTGGAAPSFSAIGKKLIEERGVRGLWKGLAPRMMNVALWGTAMVTTYEFLKRMCALPDEVAVENE